MTAPPRIALANLPTPLVRLERLVRELGDAHFNAPIPPRIWMKRDDLTGLELSGNKIRKLEYVAAEALATGCDTIVTEGTCQSNHCRATAAVCAKLGLHCELMFRPLSDAPPQGNALLDQLFGARIRWYSREELAANRAAIVEQIREELTAAGRRPRFVPTGASEPLGCWGYIRAAHELGEQLAADGIRECDLIVAVSSGGTYAGLLLGVALNGFSGIHVHAVPVSDDVAYHRREVTALCQAAIEQFRLPVTVRAEELSLIDGYVGEGYAIPYAAAIDSLRLLARTEGIMLDPVYTAKAFAALLDGVRSGRFGRERPVVFLHTGGVFSNFAWPATLMNDKTG